MRRILFTETDFSTLPNPPAGFKYIGFDGPTFTEKDDTGSSTPTGGGGGGSASFTEITYQALRTLQNGSGFNPGGYYLITDYKTCYDQPDFSNVYSAITVGNYKGGTVSKPILVQAISATALSPDAYQPMYPKDKIKYDISFTQSEVTGGTAYGRITERIDEFGNRTDYDHREVLFKRYRQYYFELNDRLSGTVSMASTGIVTGTYSVFTDLAVDQVVAIPGTDEIFFKVTSITDDYTMSVTGSYIPVINDAEIYNTSNMGYVSYYRNNVDGNDYRENYTFHNITAYNNYFGDFANRRDYEGMDFLLANNVMKGGGSNDNTFGNMCFNNTFDDDCSGNKIGDWFYQNNTDDDFDNNIIGNNFYDNVINANFQRNKIGNGFNNNRLFGTDFNENNIGTNFNHNFIAQNNDYDFYHNKIGNYFEYNTIRGEFSRNDIGNNFVENDIISVQNFVENKIGNYFQYNLIDSEFNRNQIENNFNQNIVKVNFYDNNIGNDFLSNYIYNWFYENTIEDSFENNTIGNIDEIGYEDFIRNQVGPGMKGNILDGSSSANVFGYGFYSNEIYSDMGGNRIGSYFFFNNIGTTQSEGTFEDNIIGNGFYSNDIVGYFGRNNIMSNFWENVTSNNFAFNTIGDNFSLNNIASDFGYGFSEARGNRIGNYFQGNIVGEYFYDNDIADRFNSNTTGDYFQQNEVKSYVTGIDFTEYNGRILAITHSFSGSLASVGASYSNLTAGTYSGTGQYAGFDVTVIAEDALEVKVHQYPNGLTQSGYRYSVNDTLTIFGSSIGGVDITDNVVITVTQTSGNPSVYGTYSTVIFKGSGGTNRLSYYDSSDVLTITDIDK